MIQENQYLDPIQYNTFQKLNEANGKTEVNQN
jgi:hypothetical protein